jgi:VanZ family protein
MKKDPLVGLLGLTALLILYAALYPFDFGPRHSVLLEWYAPNTPGNLLDVVLNLCFFLPLGLFWGWRFQGNHSVKWGLLLCFGISCTVEVAQAFLPMRYSSSRDVLMNTLGGYLGILAARMPLFDRDRLTRGLAALLEQRGIWVLTGMWLAMNFAPFIPKLRWRALDQAIEFTKPLESWGTPEMELFLGAFLLVAVWDAWLSPRALLLGSLVLLPLLAGKVLTIGRPGGFELVVPLWAGSLAGLSLSVAGKMPTLRWLWLVGLSWVVWKQVMPLEWNWAERKEFAFLPFAATFETPRALALPTLAGKCYLYWLVARLGVGAFAGYRWRVCGGLVALLLVTEWLQQWQPGRTPEITDGLLAALAAMPGLGLLEHAQGLKRVER